MYADERQQYILRRALDQGRVEVSGLAEDLDVTSETIRRDLTVLESRGAIKRVHGGAVPLDRLGFEPAVPMRDTVMIAEKERIAKAALAELPEEGAVIIDSGTTTARLVSLFPDDRQLTVVTNGLNIAMALSARDNVTVMLLGGRIRQRTLASVETWAVDALAHTFVSVAFVGANGVSASRGLTTPDPAEGAVKRAMIAAAQRTVVLADHTKVDTHHLVRFASLDQIDTIITDTALDDVGAATLEAAGPRVVRA